jgi:hypothetical protein
MEIFEEGTKVICISNHFPVIKEYGGTGNEAINTPQKGEILIVNEVLGDFLRFDKYDTTESFNWWKSDRFSLIKESYLINYDKISIECN